MANALFFGDVTTPWEASEITTALADDWAAIEDPNWKQPMAAWRPVPKEAAATCQKRETLFVGGFGAATKGPTKAPKKYHYRGTFTHPDGSFRAFKYSHCHGTHRILIRKVQPSPEIHLHMQPMRQGGVEVTAVAENGCAILEFLVLEDVRFQQWRGAVKLAMVQLELCTRQTDLTIYHDNILMTSNTIIRCDWIANNKNRFAKVVAALDGPVAYGAYAPKVGVPHPAPPPQTPRPTRWSSRMEKIMEGVDLVTDDYATTSDAEIMPEGKEEEATEEDSIYPATEEGGESEETPQPKAKRRKRTAVADGYDGGPSLSGDSSSASSSAAFAPRMVARPCVSARPSATAAPLIKPWVKG
jgi:hypothetical protein